MSNIINPYILYSSKGELNFSQQEYSEQTRTRLNYYTNLLVIDVPLV